MARSAPTPAPSGDVDKSILIADHGKPSYGAISHDTPVCGNAQRQKQQPTPLPVGQILVLSLTRMSEPLTFTVLFPFVNQMIVDTGQVAVENVGYTVGMVETSFSLTQIIFLLYWSRAADRYGRKPVLLFSLFGAFLASILFGFSTRVWHMYAARCLAGIFGGNAVVIRTLFAEVSDKTNQARAFSYFAFSASIGALIGPAIGGFLSRPAQEYPRQFGHVQLFIDYPYALPCLIAGLYVLLTMIAAHYWLEEPNRDVSPAPIAVRSILTPRIMSMLSIFGWTVTLSFSLSALIPLHLFTPVSLGGQGQTPSQIAQVVGASGFFQSLWLLIAMPKLDQLLGTRRLFIWTAAAYPVVMVLPVLASIASRRNQWGWNMAVLSIYVSLGSGVNMTFTSVQLLLNSIAPPAALTIVNGLAIAICAVVKSIFPVIVNATYAYGVSNHILCGYLAWVLMAVMGAGVLGCALAMPNDPEEREFEQLSATVRIMQAETSEAAE